MSQFFKHKEFSDTSLLPIGSIITTSSHTKNYFILNCTVLSFPLCEPGLFFIHSFSMKIRLWLLVIRCLHNGWNANRLNERRFVDGRGSFLSALTSTAKKTAREKRWVKLPADDLAQIWLDTNLSSKRGHRSYNGNFCINYKATHRF